MSALVAVSLAVVVFTPGERRRMIAFASCGLFFGATLGLSASPILAATLTGVFSIAGIVIPVALSGERRALLNQFMPAVAMFALTAVVGTLGGIIIRTNDLLNFAPQSVAVQLERLGLSKSQIELVLDRYAQTIALRSPENCAAIPIARVAAGPSALLVDKGQWRQLRKQYPDDKNLIEAMQEGLPDLGKRISQLRSCGLTEREIVGVLSTYVEE